MILSLSIFLRDITVDPASIPADDFLITCVSDVSSYAVTAPFKRIEFENVASPFSFALTRKSNSTLVSSGIVTVKSLVSSL